MWLRRSALLQFQYSLIQDFKGKMTTIPGFCLQLEHLAWGSGLDTHIAFFICASKFPVASVFTLFAFLITFIR